MSTPPRTRRLGDVADVLRGQVPAKPDESPDGEPFFGLTEITNQGRGPRRYARQSEIPPDAPTLKVGDVVVALMSGIGRAVLVTPRIAGSVLGRECAVIRPTDASVTGGWIYVWTQSPEFRDLAERHTRGSTMPRLSTKALPDFTIAVPDRRIQRSVVDKLHDFDTALDEVEQLRSALAELRELEIQLALAERNRSATPSRKTARRPRRG